MDARHFENWQIHRNYSWILLIPTHKYIPVTPTQAKNVYNFYELYSAFRLRE